MTAAVEPFPHSKPHSSPSIPQTPPHPSNPQAHPLPPNPQIHPLPIYDFRALKLTERKLSVLVHGRDFAVGEFIASNIVTAVKESRKTLVVLTRNFLNSTWCNFEMHMANMESVHTGRPVLVFLIKESIPTTELTSDLETRQVEDNVSC
uniref:TIR domain-containing protein n=1 Tax=Biomphalaria glabrata TaxID=6526 RepID=A0A2C9LCR7_BIOGL